MCMVVVFCSVSLKALWFSRDGCHFRQLPSMANFTNCRGYTIEIQREISCYRNICKELLKERTTDAVFGKEMGLSYNVVR